MASSLAKQLAKVAAKSNTSLNIKVQKTQHAKSLVWEPSVASTQSFATIYTACYASFDELCHLDDRFVPFADTLYSEQSQTEDRTQYTEAENAELDRKIEAFLLLLGGRLRLSPAVGAVEWLVRRFRVHEFNTKSLLMTFLPYHTLPIFVTLMSILPPSQRLPYEFNFLAPYMKTMTPIHRSAVVLQAVNQPGFLVSFSEHVLSACRRRVHYPTQISFWGGVLTEALNRLLDKGQAGERAMQADNDMNLLQRFGPILSDTLDLKTVPQAQIAGYMAVSIFVAKGEFGDKAVTAFMEQIVQGWSTETVQSGLICLSTLTQYSSAGQVSSKVAKGLAKVPRIEAEICGLAREWKMDRLANGLCLTLAQRVFKKGDARGMRIIQAILQSPHPVLTQKQMFVLYKALLMTALGLDDANDSDGAARREIGRLLMDVAQDDGPGGLIVQRVVEEANVDMDELEMKLDLALRPVLPQPKDQNSVERSGEEDTSESNHAASSRVEALQAELASLATRKPPSSSRNFLMAHQNPSSSSSNRALFVELSSVFVNLVAVSAHNASLLETFSQLPLLASSAVLSEASFASFYVAVACGPFPALARAAAWEQIHQQIRTLHAALPVTPDPQFLLPFLLASMADPARRVRQAAASVIVTLDQWLQTAASASHNKKTQLVFESLFGDAIEPLKAARMSLSVTGKLLGSILVPDLEVCLMDEDHIFTLLASLMGTSSSEKASRQKKWSSTEAKSFFDYATAVIPVMPLFTVQARFLTFVNRVRAVHDVTRTQKLLPTLQAWARQPTAVLERQCQWERMALADMDKHMANIFVPNDVAGLDGLFSLLTQASTTPTAKTKTSTGVQRLSLIEALFARLQKMWPAMKPTIRYTVASRILDLAIPPPSKTETAAPMDTAASMDVDRDGEEDDDEIPDVAQESSGLLQNVDLDTETLLSFVKSIDLTIPKTNTLANGTTKAKAVVSPAGKEEQERLNGYRLKRTTFILQLVEGNRPAKHPLLLNSLFDALAKLHAFRAEVHSELGYLQNVILQSILVMIPAYQKSSSSSSSSASTAFRHDGSAKPLVLTIGPDYGELIVNCIQSSASPAVQNSALLVMASLASTAPEVVIHVVMPVFAHVGASILRQSDDYSAHVVSQTIKEVVPPLVASFRRTHGGQRSSVVASATDLLLSFTASYEHIPPFRRLGLFSTLVDTLGADDFLFAIVTLLVSRDVSLSQSLLSTSAWVPAAAGSSSGILSFAGELVRKYPVPTQLTTIAKLAASVRDLYLPPPNLGCALLGFQEVTYRKGGEGERDKAILRTAHGQLACINHLLSSRRLRSLLAKAVDEGVDATAIEDVRGCYASVLEAIIVLSDEVRGHETLHTRCGEALGQLLNLLSISEFVRSVEKLLERPQLSLRHRVLQALEVRVQREGSTDVTSRTVLLGFLPVLLDAIRHPEYPIGYKHTAVSCVDKIAEKYGKKDVDAVAEAAGVIASESCLGHGDERLRTMALLCLSSLVDVLQDAIVPILPSVFPRVLVYLSESAGSRLPSSTGSSSSSSRKTVGAQPELHSACYTFILSICQQVPYIISASYLEQILALSWASSETLVVGSVSVGAGDDVAMDVDDDNNKTSSQEDVDVFVQDAQDARKLCLQSLARLLDAKLVLSTLVKSWNAAVITGFRSIREFLLVLDCAVERNSKSVITKNVGYLAPFFLEALDLRRLKLAFLQMSIEEEAKDGSVEAKKLLAKKEKKEVATIEDVEGKVHQTLLQIIYRLNDAAFRPIFTRIVEWTAEAVGTTAAAQTAARLHRLQSAYAFFGLFFSSLQSIVTSYATYIVDDAVRILRETQSTLAQAALAASPRRADLLSLRRRVLRVLTSSFEHDRDDFWQAPSHFDLMAPVLVDQLTLAPFLPDTVWEGSNEAENSDDNNNNNDNSKKDPILAAIVAFAGAADSQPHQRELNSSILKHLRNTDHAAVRLAAVVCEQALADKHGEEWLAMLPEMLPYISELQDDDDEFVERETHRWIVKIEGVLGESLDSMLQ